MADRRKPGFFNGVPGQTLFDRPFMERFRSNPPPDSSKKTQGIDDDRLLAIVSALVVEERLDHLLGLFLPGYEKLQPEQFGFCMKIRLLEALKLIPLRFTRAADCIRLIRNEFAHDLNKKRFEDLDQKLLTHLKALREQTLVKPEPRTTFKDMFRTIHFFCVAGLDAYSANVGALREDMAQGEWDSDEADALVGSHEPG